MARFLLVSLCLLFSHTSFAKKLKIYIDADFTSFKSSAQAIKTGLLLALKERDFKVNGYEFEVVGLDHQGNTRRSLHNVKKFIKDDSAFFIMAGLHSPPLITNKKIINSNKVLTLVPWAAGGPITRVKEGENWIYRLSIDDAQAGEFIANYAVTKNKCKRPYLILENTGWGKSNHRNMTKGLKVKGTNSVGISWFDWKVTPTGALEIAIDSKKKNADCAFFVGNAIDAETIFNAFGKGNKNIKFFSHWGITGGKNEKMAETISKNNLKLKVIQSSFTFYKNKKLNNFQKERLTNLYKYFPEIKDVNEIKSQPGLIHSYDLMQILFAAIEKSKKGLSAINLREEVKGNMENLSSPVSGLLRTYKKPFTKYKENSPNAHEAIGPSNYRMATFSESGNLMLE